MKKNYPTTESVLRLLFAGVALTSLIIMPHATLGLAALLKVKEWQGFRTSQLKKTVDRLRKRKLLKIIERDSETLIELTDLGKREILIYDLARLTIKKPSKWDHLWWMVIFDIAEKYRNKRYLFRKKLLELGFYFIQKSVCIYPYPCHNEIEFLREVYNIKRGVNVLKVVAFEGEYIVKQKFGLT